MDNNLPPKSPFASLTIWGAITAIGSGAVGVYQGVKTGDVELMSTSLTGIIGGVMAIIGRYKAAHPLK